MKTLLKTFLILGTVLVTGSMIYIMQSMRVDSMHVELTNVFIPLWQLATIVLGILVSFIIKTEL